MANFAAAAFVSAFASAEASGHRRKEREGEGENGRKNNDDADIPRLSRSDGRERESDMDEGGRGGEGKNNA